MVKIMFCSTGKTSKSRKSTGLSASNKTANNNNNNNNNNNIIIADNLHLANNNNTSSSNLNISNNSINHNSSNSHINNIIATSPNSKGCADVGDHLITNEVVMRYRYVVKDFHAGAVDEISVYQGDVVYFEFSDSNATGTWAHVLRLKSNQHGFVPSDILSIEPRTSAHCKKKLPRSNVEPVDYNQGLRNSRAPPPSSNNPHHLQSLHHQHDGMPPQMAEDNMRLTRNQYNNITNNSNGNSDNQRRFDLANSLQGSSGGKHSLQKYLPDLAELSPPAYYNVKGSGGGGGGGGGDGLHYEGAYDVIFKQFHREDLGIYVVTHNYIAREENDLEVCAGECVTLLNRDDSNWYWVRRRHEEGFVPAKYVCDYDQVKSILDKGNSTVTMKSSNHNDFHTYINHRPEIPNYRL